MRNTMKKSVKEWTVKFPWGNVAMVSWGDPAKPPILLVHGYMDSAVTFIPLIELLPTTYYYVAFDLPGHGKSDTYPPGMIISHLWGVEIMRVIIDQMKWNSFIFISHSRGFFEGVFYNHFYPGKITQMIHMDPSPPLSMCYYAHYKPMYWYHYFYESYYNSYDRWSSGNSRHMTYDEAINLIVRNRNITEEQAEVVLSRSLIPVDDNKYRLSWEGRMKKLATIPVSEESLFTVITEHAPPMLFIEASENRSVTEGKKYAANIISKCCSMIPNCSSITVTGGHDVHITNPEIIVLHIEKFLNDETKRNKSKL